MSIWRRPKTSETQVVEVCGLEANMSKYGLETNSSKTASPMTTSKLTDLAARDCFSGEIGRPGAQPTTPKLVDHRVSDFAFPGLPSR
mmetsp:Transcript_2777/g.5933  ORF Transcript_2777/g.5933 Transcript_2777/m.5933 type:complete len:87 (+) Transcript_2777:106-366(+)